MTTSPQSAGPATVSLATTHIADPGASRPLVPNDPAHRAIVSRLRAAGVISKEVPEKDGLRVSLFRSVHRR